jgi:PqqA peptide cyclase
MELPRPLGLLAELTHRCPLGCPYCSNPLALESRDDELDAGTWSRVFKEAAALGVLHVHLSGGEPGLRRDLVDIAANAREAGLSTNLITSGVGITTRTMRDLWEAGLDHVHVSIQDADAVSADRIAGYRGAFQRKHALAAEAVRLGLPLTVNFIVHRANIERIAAMVDLALKLKATRIEIAHVQYDGWALKNRAALIPTGEQVTRAAAAVEDLRHKHHDRIVIDAEPDCVGDWDRLSLKVTPSGRVLPRYGAESIPGPTFWNVRDHALGDIWANSPAFKAFRGPEFLPAPCVGRVAELAAVQQDTPYVHRRM